MSNSARYDIHTLYFDHSSGFSPNAILEIAPIQALDNYLFTVKSDKTYTTAKGAGKAAHKALFTINSTYTCKMDRFVALLHDGSYVYILGFGLKYEYEITRKNE